MRSPRRKTPLLVVVLACLTLAAMIAAAPAGAAAKPRKMYWGAWIGDQLTGEEAPFDMRAVSRFEGKLGKSLSLVEFGSVRGLHAAALRHSSFPTTPCKRSAHTARSRSSAGAASIPASLRTAELPALRRDRRPTTTLHQRSPEAPRSGATPSSSASTGR